MTTIGIVGQPKLLQECEPGALVRVIYRADSRFAIAVSVKVEEQPRKLALLDEADGFPLIDIGGAEPVISYGRSYRIRESMKPHALSAVVRSAPGHIELRLWEGYRVAHLVTKTDRFPMVVDLQTGCLSSQFGGAGFNIVRWSVHLLLPDGATPLQVFEATGSAN